VKFAREGYVFMFAGAVVALLALAFAAARPSWQLWLLAVALTVVAIWVAYFFRDPERNGERGDRLVVSPADGRVVLLTEVDEPDFVRAGRSVYPCF